MYVGWDTYADATTRGQIRSAFEPGSSIVANWDVMEGVLDYVFLKLGIEGNEGGIGRPVMMTEPVANLGYSRKSESNYRRLRWRMLSFISNERDPVRMLFCTVCCVWNRCPAIV